MLYEKNTNFQRQLLLNCALHIISDFLKKSIQSGVLNKMCSDKKSALVHQHEYFGKHR